MYGKSNMETYITTCKIDSRWEFAVWLPFVTSDRTQERAVLMIIVLL